MNPEYKTLTHIPRFRWMVLQNFPFIEDDFDALTDYGFLCKVVEYLNKVIEQQNLVNDNTNSLYQTFIELKNYVDNYFNNLDVQEEINNKLDAMVESGQLQTLLSEVIKIRFLNNYSSYCETINVDGTNYIDWLPAFNKALEEFTGALYIANGTYYISDTIVLNHIQSLIGNGKNETIIKLIPNQTVTGDAIVKINFNYCEIKDLKIEGSSTSYGYNENDTEIIAGLYLANSNANHCLIDNVFIGRINGNGIKLDFTSYDTILTNITINYCAENGIWCDATDVFISKCICFRIDKHGFYITHGNNLIEQCKAYFTGMINKTTPTNTGCGFYEETYQGNSQHTNRYVNCESQEAGWHGFYCNGSDGNQYVGCQSDTNGVFIENSYGFYLNSIKNCYVQGIVVNKEYLGGENHTGKNDYGLYLTGNFNVINLNVYLEKQGTPTNSNTKFYKKLYNIEKNVSNEVIINGYNVNEENYKNQMYIDDNNDGVVNDFAEQKIGTVVTEVSIDYNEMAQKIAITDSTGASVNNAIKIVKQIGIPTGITKFSFVCDKKETNKTNNCPLVFRVRCYDSNDTLLSTTDKRPTQVDFVGNENSKDNWTSFYYTYDITENTSYIKLEILLTLNTVNSINTALLKNLKYKLY